MAASLALTAVVLVPLVKNGGKWRGDSGGEYRLSEEELELSVGL